MSFIHYRPQHCPTHIPVQKMKKPQKNLESICQNTAPVPVGYFGFLSRVRQYLSWIHRFTSRIYITALILEIIWSSLSYAILNISTNQDALAVSKVLWTRMASSVIPTATLQDNFGYYIHELTITWAAFRVRLRVDSEVTPWCFLWSICFQDLPLRHHILQIGGKRLL